jgi:hypothetical protein
MLAVGLSGGRDDDVKIKRNGCINIAKRESGAGQNGRDTVQECVMQF